MSFFGSLKNALRKGIHAGKSVYDKAHSIHQTYHNFQDRVDRFNARREAEHIARPVNREMNKSTTKKHVYLQEAARQANGIADKHGYSNTQREELKAQYLKKYEAEATKRESEAAERRARPGLTYNVNDAGLKVVSSIGNRPVVNPGIAKKRISSKVTSPKIKKIKVKIKKLL